MCNKKINDVVANFDKKESKNTNPLHTNIANWTKSFDLKLSTIEQFSKAISKKLRNRKIFKNPEREELNIWI